MKHKVYLIGPMSGVSYDDSNRWREEAREYFKRYGIEVLSPLDRQRDLANSKSISDTYPTRPFGTAKSVIRSDHRDVQEADALLANFSGAKKVSIGSIFELAWGWENNKPIVIVEDHLHKHAMIDEAVWWKANSPKEACDILITYLTRNLV